MCRHIPCAASGIVYLFSLALVLLSWLRVAERRVAAAERAWQQSRSPAARG